MKRFLAGFLTAALLFSVSNALAEDLVRLVVNGKEISFPEAPPTIINNRVMVPARPLAEALGAQVGWDAESRTVIVTQKAAEATAPAPDTLPATIQKNGVTYFHLPTFRDNLPYWFYGHDVSVDGSGFSIDGKRYELDVVNLPFLSGTVGYVDLAPLVDAGIIGWKEIHAIYSMPSTGCAPPPVCFRRQTRSGPVVGRVRLLITHADQVAIRVLEIEAAHHLILLDLADLNPAAGQ